MLTSSPFSSVKIESGREARDELQQQTGQRLSDRLPAKPEAAELPDLLNGPRLGR